MLFWIVQGLGLLSLVFYAVSLQQKTQAKFLILTIIGDIIFALQYYLSGTMAGAITFTISIVFALIVFLHRDKKVSIYLLAFFILMIVVSCSFTWANFWSIIPILMNTLNFVRFWYGNVSFSKYAALVLTVGWSLYSVVTGNFGGAITQAVIFVAAVVGIWREQPRKA